MLKRLLGILALATLSWGQDAPCVVDGGSSYVHTDLGGGATRVTQASWFAGMPMGETLVGEVTRAQLEAHYDALLDSPLVFIARIDSTIQLAEGDASKPLTPWKTLALDSSPSVSKYFRFYARMQIDTILSGSLPGSSLWIEGWRGQTCQFTWSQFRGGRFLNASASFARMSDLKLDLLNPWMSQISGYWFDGQYLTTPSYYGVRLDIRDALPGYPVGLVPARVPGRLPEVSGAGYLPDGRRAPGASESGRKVPLPVLK